MINLYDKISRKLLPRVKNPGQYIGQEFNQIRKHPAADSINIALAFPDTYALGMSHLGLSILYTALNIMEGVIAERVFCPWLDAAEVMRSENIPLFTWETRRPVREFDMLGITLQHELTYSNVLYLLDLAGITFRAAQRTGNEPLIIGGGPMADCCEPVADFFDIIILGDGEETFPDLVLYYRKLKKRGINRKEMLIKIAQKFDFAYVPQLYQCNYNNDGTISSFFPTIAGIATGIKRSLVTDMDNAIFPTSPVMAHTETPHDRIAIEVMRGCPQRCAFCHAGHTRGKIRYRSVEKILEIAQKSYKATGNDTISLLSLSTSDYPHLAELVQKLYLKFAGKHVGISLPSLRVDKQLRDVPAQVNKVRKEGLTVAVETANDLIRKAIGKRVTDDDLFATMLAAYQAGWRRVKLYFMVGFPGETPNDIANIINLAAKISKLRCEMPGKSKGPAAVNIAVSWLVPKPHTPFGWIAQADEQYFENAKNILINTLHQHKGVSLKLKFHNAKRSLLEGVFARGDRRLSKVLEIAYSKGACFDAWDECFSYETYIESFEQCKIDPNFYAHRQRNGSEILPWDHLAGDNRNQLYKRLIRIKETLNIT